jgi:hypothetical protein
MQVNLKHNLFDSKDCFEGPSAGGAVGIGMVHSSHQGEIIKKQGPMCSETK